MKKVFLFLLTLVLVVGILPVAAQDAPAIDCITDEEATVVLSTGSVGIEVELAQRAADEFMAACPNITIEVRPLPESATDILGFYLQQFEAQSSEIDVFQFDVIWPGILAEHMVNMYDYISEEALADYFPAIVANNTVDGSLTGIPYFNDAPMLYYRTDLLEEYGVEVPQTWEELAVAAQTIQDGERAKGNSEFWGYVWQGNAYEGLTCDALEWIYSEAGSTIVDAEGNITVNDPAVAFAIDRAATWVGTISPEGVTGYQEEDARSTWQAGNAAFMRNWPYAYALGNGEDSAVAGSFGVALLPTGAAGLRAATQGGWQLGVSRYAENPAAAAAVAIYFTSPTVQKYRALESYLPTAMSLYSDAELLEANPFFADLFPVLSNTVTRPSTVTAARYNEVSTAFFSAVHSVLVGESDGATAMELLELDLQGILGQ
ncbi:MAG: ABC transporter substrate-binding protein [Anaerolinea sp.]|nr:ABC transporter substrate-binding protein [Anaerolinea sp.]